MYEVIRSYAVKDGLNRTFMELKYQHGLSLSLAFSSVLIEPLWN